MEEIRKISVEQCCTYYSVEVSFVQQLDEHGLIGLSHSGEEAFIEYDQLPDLEKYMRMHYDLHINMEGLHAIKHLPVSYTHLDVYKRQTILCARS